MCGSVCVLLYCLHYSEVYCFGWSEMCPNYHKVGDTAAAPLVPTNAAALPVFATVQCNAGCSVASLWHSEVGGCQPTVGCSALCQEMGK